MATPKRKKPASAPRRSVEMQKRQDVRDDMRKLRIINQAIAVETKRVARLLRSSNDRLSTVLHGYLEATGRLVIPQRQWDEINERYARLEEDCNALREDLGSARVAALAREREDEKARERMATVSKN